MMNSVIHKDELLSCNAKWQVTVNLLAKYLKVPAGLILQISENELDIFICSQTVGNPYKANTKLPIGEGRYFETVLIDNEILNIPNALKNKQWKNNPDLAVDMISYLGVPILWPDRSVFGTICVLDSKERFFKQDCIDLLLQFRSLFESDLQNLVHTKKIIEKEKGTSTERVENFQHLFDKNPISLWEEDFTEAMILLNKLKKTGITDVKAYLDKNPEFVQKCAKKIKIININEASVKLYKATNKEALIDNLQTTFNEHSLEIFKNELTAFANGETSFESEYEILTLTGETIHVNLKIFPIDGKEKVLSKAIVSLYDITEKVKSRNKIKKINRQLIEERNVFTRGNVVVFKWMLGSNGAVEYVSQNVSNVFGYSVEDFVSGKITFGDIVYKKDIQRIRDQISQARQKNLDSYEHKPYRIVHKNGKIVWLHDFTTIIKNKKGEITHNIGYVNDITKGKLLELEKDNLLEAVTKQRNEFESLTEEFQILNEELEYRNAEIRESEERFKKLSSSTFEGIVIHKRGIVKDLNDTIVKMFGYTRNELVGKDIIKLIIPANYHKTVFQHIKAKSEDIYEIEGRTKGGSIIPLEIQSKLSSYNGVEVRVTAVRDISDRKEKEKDLLLLNERLSVATDTGKIGIWEWDLKTDLAHWNNNMFEIHGKPNTGAMNYRNWLNFIHEDYRKKVSDAIDQLAVDGGSAQMELKIIRENGERRNVIASAKANLTEQGKINRIIGAYIDITELKIAKKDKKSSEENFRLLFENSPLGIFTALPKGQIIDANLALINVLGSPSIEETKKINVLTFPLLLENGFVDDFKEIVKSGKIIRREYSYQTKWGKIVNLWAHIFPLKDKKGQINKIYIIIEDISVRKHIENELRNQKILFETMFNAISDGIVITNKERKITLPNKGVLKMFKYSMREVIGKKTDVFYAEQTNYEDAGVKVYNEDAVKNQELYITKYKDKEGRVFTGETFGTKLFTERGEWIGNLGVIRDVSERISMINELKYAKDKAEKDEKNYREIFNNATDAIYIQDINGRFIDVNEGAENMYGYPKEYFVGKTPEFLSAPGKNDLENIGALVQMAFKGEAQQYEFWGIRKNGEVFPKIVRSQKGIYGGKDVVVTFSIDISERKKAEEELLEAKEKAEESDQLKSAFLNNLSHEIRTPMNSIVGFSQLLKNPKISSDKRMLFIDRITNSSHQLLSIVEDIINISKIDSQQIGLIENELSVNELMTELYNKYHHISKGKNIKLAYFKSLDFGKDLIFTDQFKLKQVLDNLISNAIKFTMIGSVTFGCKLLPVKTNVRSSQLEENNGLSLQFYVKDTGIGIDKSMHNEIFDRFRQVELSATREFGGLGLGLAISKAYIELMGGKIWMESELNKGSEFYFTLPYRPVDKKWLNYTKYIFEKKEIKWNNKTILIAEDDQINYLLLVELLAKTGLTILHAKTGREAIDICLSRSLDLILMDIKMPDLDGYQATKIIKQKFPNLKVIAQTAYAHPSDERKAKEAGCDDYIAKPIIKEQLFKTMNKYLKE